MLKFVKLIEGFINLNIVTDKFFPIIWLPNLSKCLGRVVRAENFVREAPLSINFVM